MTSSPRRRRIAAAGFMLWLLLLPAAGRAQSDDRLIVPGQRIGMWSLAVTVADLIRTAGPPAVQEAAEANRPSVTVLTWTPPGITAVSKDRIKIDLLYQYGGDYRTERNIGRGSTADAARRAYPRPELKALGTFSRALVYDRLGMAFVITPQRVSAVLIFPPGTAEGLRVPTILPAPAPPPGDDRP